MTMSDVTHRPPAAIGKLIGLALLAAGTLGCGSQKNSNTAQETTAVPDSAPASAEQATATAPEAAPDSTLVIENVGLETPESVLHDAARDVYLVSNINRTPLEKDNNGFISRISPEGEITALKWIAGGVNGVTLNAPKGMAIAGNVLYVSDIDTVRLFNAETGAPEGEVPIEGATFVNDITAMEDGTVYVTDTGWSSGPEGFTNTGTDAIWAISGGTARAVVRDGSLHNPNGICAAGTRLVFVNARGEVFHLSPSGDVSPPGTLPGGRLDGVVYTESGQLLISSWETRTVYLGTMEAGFRAIIENVPSPADIGYDATRRRVLIPVFAENRVRIVPLP